MAVLLRAALVIGAGVALTMDLENKTATAPEVTVAVN
jgi:hypothetical protein